MGRSRTPDRSDNRITTPLDEATRLGVGELGPAPYGRPPVPSEHALDSFEELLGLDQFEDPEPDPFDDEVPTRDVTESVAHIRRSAISSVESINTRIWQDRATPTRPAPQGERLLGGRYRLEDAVADGGMARIYKVTHIDLGKTFALKIIHRDLSRNVEARKMFEREARVASALDHPHIVQVTDYGNDAELGAYLVMEYLKGETLRARIKRLGGLPLKSGLAALLQTAQALLYMHEQDYIHCDVKSENVFLCRPPSGARERVQVKLIDFGLSRRVVEGARLATSELGGTPEYVSPEQIRGQAPQPSMDIYSLGILFYELLTGRPPFTGTPADMLFAHLNTEPTPPSKHLSEPLDEQVENFVLRLLAKDVEDRPSSMARVVYHLRTLADMLGVGGASVSMASPDQARLQLERDQLRHLVDYCPCPMFRLDARGRIDVANRAFADFVRLPLGELVGASVGTTRLCYIYPEIDVEVLRAADAGDMEPIVRIVSFPGGSKGTVTVKILLVPEVSPTGRITHYSGIIHPVNPQSGKSPG